MSGRLIAGVQPGGTKVGMLLVHRQQVATRARVPAAHPEETLRLTRHRLSASYERAAIGESAGPLGAAARGYATFKGARYLNGVSS